MLKKNIVLDVKQQKVDGFCLKIAKKINERKRDSNLLKKLLSLFYKKNNIKNIYLHGDVGGGKTILMKNFYDSIESDKKVFFHFQKFVKELHSKLHKLYKIHKDKAIIQIAKDLAEKYEILCIDEFEIKDVMNAMLIKNLFKYFAEHNVFIFVTTNTAPKNLYKDGIQRESFLPFLDFIDNNFEIIHLDNERDYRFSRISQIKKHILYPNNKENLTKFQQIKNDLDLEDDLFPCELKVFDREVKFKETHENILLTDFEELFERNLGYSDYITICEHFKVILVENVRKIKEQENNIAVRFINFIDNAYLNKVVLFMILEEDPKNIYSKGKQLKEFKRTISRLNEMNNNISGG